MTRVSLCLQGRPTSLATIDPNTASVMTDDGPRPATDFQWRLPTTGSVYGCLLNFQCEWDRLGTTINEPPYNGAPTGPVVYVKTPNTHVAFGADIAVPAGVDVTVGAALGIVVGETMTRASPQQAARSITAYTVVNDITIPHGSLFRHPIKYKCRDGFCPIGPWLVPASDVPDPSALNVRAFVNGELRQERSLADLVRPVATLLADLSDFTSLYPGDIVLAGVAAEPPRARAGDVVAVEIDNVGRLENTLIEERNVPGETS